MRKVVFVIDGWFMRKRIYKLKAFYYTGPEIRKYCFRHLSETDRLYRIFYYDTLPLDKKGHNPVTGKHVDFSKTPVAIQQKALLASIKETPHMALRLGHTHWQNNQWLLRDEKFRDLINGKIALKDLTENDVFPVIKQKAVDMKMGLDIAQIAMKRLADRLILISGDADIVPALKLARKEGMEVGLDPLWANTRPELREHVDYIATKIPNPRKPTITEGQ